jgi:uncharacterized protein
MSRGDRVVYVVAKAPQAGTTKTRLCPPLTPIQAAQLAQAFLGDALNVVRRARCEARVICRSTTERVGLVSVVGESAGICVQAGDGLGDALESAFRQGFADGFEAVGVLGPDSPTLPPLMLYQAFGAVARGADVALGPCADGGYYLLVARALHPQLFRDMAWSTSAVAATTIARCRRAHLRTHVLPTWYDVDDSASLARLCAELASGRPGVAPRTRSVLDLLPSGALA